MSDYNLITTAQMRAAEAEAIAGGVSGAALMERAGRLAADIICRDIVLASAPLPPVLVLCGPGNNGGDGYVIARILQGRGFAVTVFGLVPISALAGDALMMANRWGGPVHPPRRLLERAQAAVSAQAEEPAASPLIIDALFGIGLSRDLTGDAAAMVERANALPGWKIAIDMPSGIDTDTGAVRGTAVAADCTITFHAMKPGHLLRPGARFCGKVEIADIGLGPETTARARQSTDGPEIDINAAGPHLAKLGTDPDGHKYTRGHTLVLAGGIEGVGAARLAARAALRSGAGLVTIAAPAESLAAHAARGPDALMLRRCDSADGLAALLADQRRNAVVLGPALGVGTATRELVAAALLVRRPVVLDADALTSFEGDADGLAKLTKNSGNAVLTPHAGEFSRLFASSRPLPTRRSRFDTALTTATIASTNGFSELSALHGALLAASQCGAVVVLKGPATVIAAPDGRARINVNAPPWLATAGSGDVLAGIIGSLLSQGLGPFDAACAGVWLHGAAGSLAGRGLIADDLPEAIAKALQSLL